MIEQTRKKILIVNDRVSQLKSLEEFLKNEYEITTTKSGKEAINLIENCEFIPDLILLDLVMPLMEGMNILPKFKTSDDIESVPIVLATSVSEAELEILKDAFGTEVDCYIQTSIGNEGILEKIKRFLLE
jgi:PleD family two-component response regulator